MCMTHSCITYALNFFITKFWEKIVLYHMD